MLTQERPAQRELTRPRTPAPPPDNRRLDVQGMRAIAVTLVVLFHAGLPIKGGFIGVDVFLVISGYVITAMLLRELSSTGTVRLRRFYSRRIKRLLPALALLTTVVVVLSVFFGSSFGSQQTTAKTGMGATFFVANMVIYEDSIGYFSPEAEKNPLLHTWTLSVEEQVYLVFPSLLLGSWAVARRLRGGSLRQRGKVPPRRTLKSSRRGAAILLGVVGVASFIACWQISFAKTDLPTPFAFFSALTRVWEFAVGAGIALAAPMFRRLSPFAAFSAASLGMAAIVIGALKIDGTMPYPGAAVLVPVAGAAAVIIAGFHRDSHISKVLATKPMVWIGDLSYSWYLWHWPLIVFAGTIWPTMRWTLWVAAFASLIPAWLSMKIMENPIRHNRSIKGWRVVVIAFVCIAIPAAACLGLAAGARASWGNEQVAVIQQKVEQQHVGESVGCDDAASDGSSLDEADCQFNATATGKGPHLYLVGNSVATMYSEAMIGAAEKLNLKLNIDTSTGCFSEIKGNRECSDLFQETIEKIIERPPGVVVMSSTWDLGLYGDPTDQKLDFSLNEKANFMIESLTARIQELEAAGHHVVLMTPSPRFFYDADSGGYVATPDKSLTRDQAHSSIWRPTDCPALSANVNLASCGASVKLSEVKIAQERSYDAIKEILRSTNASAFDLRDHYCPGGICKTYDGDQLVYEDGIHISVEESQRLAPTFADYLRAVIRDEWKPAMLERAAAEAAARAEKRQDEANEDGARHSENGAGTNNLTEPEPAP